jgi:hypothetical protein
MNQPVYNDFISGFNDIKSQSANIFPAGRFKEQFLQSVYLFEEYVKRFDKKMILADLFAGIGTYSIFFSTYYRLIIKKIYATEKDEESYKLLKDMINKHGCSDMVIPCKVDKRAGFNPYSTKKLKRIKFNNVIANPPYVPIPPGKRYYSWANGGELGISGITELLKGLDDYALPKSIFGFLSYSIGCSYPEKGSLIIGNISQKLNTKLNDDYKNYLELLNKINEKWKLRFFVLNPPAWVGYKKDISKEIIALKDYYKLIFPRSDGEIKKYLDVFKPRNRYISNIFVIGTPGDNANKIKRVIIKNIGTKYIEKVMEVEKACWPHYLQASRSNLYSRLRYFSAGCVGAFDINGKMLGFATSQVVNFTPYPDVRIRPLENWMKLDNFPRADIRTTSDKKGNALHLVSGCVLSEYRNNGIWKDMIIYRLRLAKFLGLKYVVILSRLNKIESGRDTNNIMNYIERGVDPNLRCLENFGFEVNSLIPKPLDSESGGYWVVMCKKLEGKYENEQ